MAGRGLKINKVWVLEHVVCFERKRGRKRVVFVWVWNKGGLVFAVWIWGQGVCVLSLAIPSMAY